VRDLVRQQRPLLAGPEPPEQGASHDEWVREPAPCVAITVSGRTGQRLRACEDPARAKWLFPRSAAGVATGRG